MTSRRSRQDAGVEAMTRIVLEQAPYGGWLLPCRKCTLHYFDGKAFVEEYLQSNPQTGAELGMKRLTGHVQPHIHVADDCPEHGHGPEAAHGRREFSDEDLVDFDGMAPAPKPRPGLETPAKGKRPKRPLAAEGRAQ